MNTTAHSDLWPAFQQANRSRRAIREFQATRISSEDIYDLVGEAAFAPSSGNLQPYEFHWVRTPSAKEAVARACNGQRAASTAAELLVVVASPALGKKTALTQLAYIDSYSSMEPKSKEYHRKQIGKFQKILGIGGSLLLSPALFIAAMIRPTLSLLPIGPIGSRHWAARNAMFAAQTLMLGAAAKGIDSCPMEGFSATKVAAILNLPRGSVVPLVIALGYRADTARIEKRWRRSMMDVVVPH
ncbi:nitroreductase family protein [Acidovorax sp. NCPPB 3576]|uniref:nitroreductase family protein n=1 Tax=Acidovorax sp. NCPPB 3576 TaxID=2940488 RepID=UPI0023490770|nr:nitroreductase family protein [Acidovorax sp. NCPPB 3576]WCM90501.1 nitroreductase family protein [Acidovorax sp. NCPPB 3576]